jgi:CelD/BcsL family acetyltransferase involved in cellulose biosynthesis
VRPFGTTICPRLCLAGPDQPVARSGNFRRQLSRFERQLTGAGVRFVWHPPGTVDETIAAALFALHGRRRNALEAGTSLRDRHRSLLAALSRAAGAGRGPAAVVARVDERIVGVLLGFRWKDTFSAYQSGWDPEYASSSLGSVLVRNAIRFAAADGVRVFDFLRGTEPYKYRFGAVDAYDRSYLLVRNSSGRLLPFEQALRGSLRGVSRSRWMQRTDLRGDAPR